MLKHSRFAAILGCGIAIALAGCSASSGLGPPASTAGASAHRVSFGPGWVQKDGIVFHVPHYMVTREHAQHLVRPDILLTYSGGPVLVTPTTFLIFWGYKKYGDRNNIEPLLDTYVGNMGGSGHNNIYTQYYEIKNNQQINITNPAQQLGGTWDDSSPVPRHPTDAQVAAEALRGVAHFGYNANASYVVATPHGRSTAGFGTQWCAYHSATTSNGNLVSYTNLPYMTDAGASCGANIIAPPSDETGTDEGVTIVEGHEYGESVTDPNPPSGWYNSTYGENGDICAWQNIQNDPFGSFSYTMQPMFSNATQSCVHSY